MNLRKKNLAWFSTLFLFAIAMLALPQYAASQDNYDQQDDPPDRVARLGFMEGSVSFQPAGETEWVEAVSNRPITTGDRLWSDQNSRAEVELGSSVIRLSSNTGFSFLNLDDRTVQIQLTAGSINVRVRRLDSGDLFEIDTPNQAFSVFRPGNYRVEASENGDYTVVSVRDGEGESTGNGQNYTVHAGQQATFSGTDSLNAEVVDIGGSDQFDEWSNTRDRRYDHSRSAQYVSRDVVGYEDLDDYGDWRDDSNYGHVWYPTRVSSGWAPYQEGHWDWISPWGWTWVDDSPWGYAPFHYGRWVTVGGRWGWVAGPVAVRPVYAPALVVFIGGGGFGVNVGWFPLGPREVYVPSYRVSRGYVNRVNVSNTNVNVTNITNVYNTTIINKTTNITNVTYVNRNVRGAVTAVPQRTFTGAQPVGRARVNMNERDIASAQMTARVAVAPTRESVLGVRANTANRVSAPPPAIANRQVIAKAKPPAPPVPFARQQRALQQNPGQPLARREVQNLRPASAPEAHPMVKIAPPGKEATPTVGRPGNRPNQAGNQPRDARPNQPDNSPAANRPGNDRVPNQRPAAANPDAPVKPNQPSQDWRKNRPNGNQPNNQPDANRPEAPAKNDQPAVDQRDNRPNGNQPNNRPDVNRPEPPAKNDQPPSDSRNNRPAGNRPNQPDNKPANDRPAANRPDNSQPDNNRPAAVPDRPNRAPADRNADRPNADRPNADRPNANRTSDQPDVKAPAHEPNQPSNRPERPTRNDPPSAQPDRTNREPAARPNNRPDQPARNDQPAAARPDRSNAGADRPAPPPRPQSQTQEERKKQQQEEKKQKQDERDRQKRENKPPTL